MRIILEREREREREREGGGRLAHLAHTIQCYQFQVYPTS